MIKRSYADATVRAVWAFVTVLCGGGLTALYLWSDGDLFTRLFDRGTLWERSNGIVAVASLIGLTLFGSYKVLRGSHRATNGS